MVHHVHVKHCPLFQNLSLPDRTYALDYFQATMRHYEKGDFLHRVSFPLQRFGLVLHGTVQVYMDDMDGHHNIMNHVSPGELFGESYCFLGIDAPIYICATAETGVLWMSPERIKTPVLPVSSLDQALANRFVSCLAARTLKMSLRIQILSKSTLRLKLITFLSQYAADQDTFTVPFDRASMATYLGADRSALSRELSRMRQEGLIAFHRNQFQILRDVPVTPPDETPT